MSDLLIRHAEPADHARVTAVLDGWWGGQRRMVDMLPRLFTHFRDTSFVAERGGALSGFLIGFLSQSEPDAAYVHFVGVSPLERGSGLGREPYERFFEVARAHGRRTVSCVTSPANAGSLAFHRAIGFEPSPPQAGYDGPGEDTRKRNSRYPREGSPRWASAAAASTSPAAGSSGYQKPSSVAYAPPAKQPTQRRGGRSGAQGSSPGRRTATECDGQTFKVVLLPPKRRVGRRRSNFGSPDPSPGKLHRFPSGPDAGRKVPPWGDGPPPAPLLAPRLLA